MCIVLYLGAPLLVKYMLSTEFSESLNVIRIRAISLIFSAIVSAYGANYLIIKRREVTLRKITMWCSIVGFVIAWPLVYAYSYIGAALTVTISLALLAITCFVISKTISDKSE